MRKSSALLLIMLAALGLCLAQEAEPPSPEKPDTAKEKAPAEPIEKPLQQLPVEIRPSSDERLDVIVAVDASGSVAWTDPHSFRKAFTDLLGGLMRLRAGDRLAIVQFAGWNETSRKGAVLLDLEEIPEDSALFTSDVKSAVNRLEPFGAASDFNFAFEKAIQEIFDKRAQADSKNKVWLVLISDGSMEVVESEGVREAYLSRVDSQGKRANRESLNEAATQMFYESVLPKVAENKELHLSCICLGKEEPGEVVKRLGELDNASVIRFTQQNLKDVMVKAFSELPEGYPDYGVPKGFGYLQSSVQAGSSLMHSFSIYEGTAVTRLMVLADAQDYALDLKNPAGESIVAIPSVSLAGEGTPSRLVTITGEPAGAYELVLTNESGTAAGFEVLQYVDMKLDLYVGTKGLRNEFYPGETLLFDVGLREAKSSVFVTDRALISEAEVFLLVRDVDGNITKNITPFVNTSKAETSAQYVLPADAPGGEYELAVRVAAFKDTLSGRYAFVCEPVTIPFSVLSPVVELQLCQKTALVGQEIGLTGAVTKGSLTEKQKLEGIKGKIVHTISHTEKEIDLRWDEESNSIKGTVSLDEPKEWQLQKVQIGTGQVKPVDPEQVLVKPRTLRIMLVGEDGTKTPVDKLRVKGKIGSPITARFIVEPDLVPGEITELSVSPGGLDASAELSISLTGKEGSTTNLSVAESQASYDMVLNLKKRPEEEEIGEIVVTSKFPGVTISRKIPVSTDIPARAFPWLPVAVIAGLVAATIILLLMLLGGPTFDQQQLYIIGGQGHYLKEWKIGRRNAMGTTLNPEKLLFRLKGGKAKPQCMVMPGKSARLFVNNVECTYWKGVKHGDYIEIYPEGDEYAYRYRYFDRNPTAAELREPEGVTEEIDRGVFLEEDEFILAEDDEYGLGGGDATQALLEQARRLKQRVETDPTELLVQSSERSAADALDEVFSEEGPEYEQTEIIREAAALPHEQDMTEAVPPMPMPDEPTEAITSGFFGEEEGEATQAIRSDDEVFFEEMPTEEGVADEGFDLPVAEDVESEPTQAISDEFLADELAGEATQAIIPESEFEEDGVLTEPTEEFGDEDVDELTGLIEDRLEMSEFIEEEPAGPEDDSGTDLADELDKTFDKILGEEEEEKDL